MTPHLVTRDRSPEDPLLVDQSPGVQWQEVQLLEAPLLGVQWQEARWPVDR
jgi:hypothetical protein